jgi:hypothetical protein
MNNLKLTRFSKKRKREKQDKFVLEYFANVGRIGLCCEKVGITRQDFELWLDTEPNFKKRLEYARERWNENLEAVILKRAVEKSDDLAKFILQAHKPEIYDPQVRKIKYINDNMAKELDCEGFKFVVEEIDLSEND